MHTLDQDANAVAALVARLERLDKENQQLRAHHPDAQAVIDSQATTILALERELESVTHAARNVCYAWYVAQRPYNDVASEHIDALNEWLTRQDAAADGPDDGP